MGNNKLNKRAFLIGTKNYKSLSEPMKKIFMMIDNLVGFTEKQIELIKSISEKSFNEGYNYSL